MQHSISSHFRVVLGTIACGVVSFGLAMSAVAATVADYDVANANAGTSAVVNVASADANVSATTMTSQGALGAAFNSAQTFCYLDWPTGVLDPSKFYEFAITPAAGYQVAYTSVDLAVASGGAGTGTFEIHASTDGFGSSDIILATQNFPNDATWHAYNLSLAALGSQVGTITFRFYMYNMPASGFSGLGVSPAFGSQGRNLTVNGTVSLTTVAVEENTWGGVKGLYSSQ